MNLKNFTLTFFALLLAAFSLNAQDLQLPGMDPSPLDAAHYPPEAAYRNYLEGDAKNTQEQIKVLYSRPQKKGRDIFGGLVPYGQLWRLGANEGTEITFYGPVEINNSYVEPGTYTINAEIYPDQWIVKLSTERFIAGSANLDASKVILAVAIPTKKLANVREAFTIGFQKVSDNIANLVIEWDRTRVDLPINLSPANLPPLDVSPMDLAQFPSMSRFSNLLESDEERAANKAKARVVYSRPQKKGRTIFGDLVKYDAVWRLGANESTEITFFEDVVIGSTEVKAGTYGLIAMVKEGSWEFIVHKGIPSWGEFGHDDKNNIAKVSGPVEKMDEEVEALTMAFEEKGNNTIHLIVAWGKTMARMPIKMK